MTPVLAMTVVREAAIAAFVPEKFYTVALTLADGGTASSKRFAQKELNELPTPAQLKERYPDTSRWDARLQAALHKRRPVLKMCIRDSFHC